LHILVKNFNLNAIHWSDQQILPTSIHRSQTS
jgi:hypothetical protein